MDWKKDEYGFCVEQWVFILLASQKLSFSLINWYMDWIFSFLSDLSSQAEEMLAKNKKFLADDELQGMGACIAEVLLPV